MPNETREKPEIKVTDKRIFTAEGEIREEFRNEIKPGNPEAARPAPAAAPPPAPDQRIEAVSPDPAAERRRNDAGAPPAGERRKTLAERGESPGTPFANFLQSLVMQTYMMLGMLRNPYQPQTKPDAVGARELIDIISMLQQKTNGNLTPDEEDFIEEHLGQLKLAYVQVTKNLS